MMLDTHRPTGFGSILHQTGALHTAPLQCDYQAILDATVDAVFAAISNSECLCGFVPGLQHASVGQSERGLVRRCDFGNDMIVEEQIILWQPPSAYAYAAIAPNPFGLREHYATVTCNPCEEGTHLRWQHFFEHDDLAAMKSVLDGVFEQIFDGLLAQFGGQKLTTAN
ncbi:MAG: SRPBCC family protein [Chloroflexota bacterium]